MQAALVLVGLAIAGAGHAQTAPDHAGPPDISAAAQEAATPPQGRGPLGRLVAPVTGLLADSGFALELGARMNLDAVTLAGGPASAAEARGTEVALRRLRLRGRGTLPGGIGWQAEIDLTDRELTFDEILLSRRVALPEGRRLDLLVGNIQTPAGLDAAVGSQVVPFLEKAGFNEAFGNVSRLGGAVRLAGVDDLVTAEVALLGGTINADRANSRLVLAGRVTLIRPFAGGQLQLGVSAQHRLYDQDSPGYNYRARPFSRLIDTRFIATGSLAIARDDVLGVEAALARGPVHVGAEAQWVHASGFPDGNSGGAVILERSPRFSGFYLEGGGWLTGERPVFARGRWESQRVLRPLGRGGFGALGLNARLDQTDLTDFRIATVAPGGLPDRVDAGRQTGLLGSAIWQPRDNVRLTFQLTRLWVQGGPAQPAPTLADPRPRSERRFSGWMSGARLAIDL